MRFGVVVLLFAFLLPVVQAELVVPCHQESDCAFALGRDVSCVQDLCMMDKVAVQEQRSAVAPFQLREGAVAWDIFVVREVPSGRQCPENSCFSFAPVSPPSPFLSFLQWFVSVKYGL